MLSITSTVNAEPIGRQISSCTKSNETLSESIYALGNTAASVLLIEIIKNNGNMPHRRHLIAHEKDYNSKLKRHTIVDFTSTGNMNKLNYVFY